MHLQAVSIEQTPSTKRQHVDEVPNRIQPELKRPRIEVNGSSLEENRSSVTKTAINQQNDEVPDLIQPEPKRPRIEVNGSSLEENRSPVTTNSNKPIEHTSKNRYRWRSEDLITFPWLEYDVENATARCRFAGCKMYHVQFLTSNIVVGGSILALNPDCLASMRILKFINHSVVNCRTKDKLN